MTLQSLEYFIAVARYKNFTRAAQECFVTQPALSRAIRELEEELQCQLLIRTSRSVVLTAAGEACLEEARRITALCRKLPKKMRHFTQTQDKPLLTGYVIYDHLMSFVGKISGGNPGNLPVPLDTRYSACSEMKRLFSAGELDIALLPEPCVADLVDVECASVFHAKAAVLVSNNSPFFERKSLRMSELCGSRFVEWSRRETPLLSETYTVMLREAGVEPQVVDSGEKLGDIITRVIMHNAVGFASTLSRPQHVGDVRIIPVEDSPERFGLLCVWHKGAVNPGLRLIRRLLKEADQ